jgi:uncharacterized protein YndB with AHSA1/START domain
MKLAEVTLSRLIPASPEEVFDVWLDPASPGSAWHGADKIIISPTVDGLFYWGVGSVAVYGRFIVVNRPGRVEHSWVSEHTGGLETIVNVTFAKHKQGTRMTIVHRGLPRASAGAHEDGWTQMLDKLEEHFATSFSLSAN